MFGRLYTLHEPPSTQPLHRRICCGGESFALFITLVTCAAGVGVDTRFKGLTRLYTDFDSTTLGKSGNVAAIPKLHGDTQTRPVSSRRPIFRGTSTSWSTDRYLVSSKARIKAPSQSSLRWSKLPRIYFGTTDGRLHPGEEVAVEEQPDSMMRIRAGSKVRLFNEHDGEHLCTIISPHRKKRPALVKVDELILPPKPTSNASSRLTLYFAVIKRQRLKTLFEMISEVGVACLVPVITQNTQVDIAMDFCQRQLVQCAEQSSRMHVPKLGNPLPIAEMLNAWQATGSMGRLLVCRERSAAQPLLITLREAFAHGEMNVSLFVGPEGGFTDGELLTLEQQPFVKFVSLGNNVLRSETASFVALGIAAAAIDELR